jgi:hypothetical protein
VSCEFPEWFRNSPIATDDMAEQVLQGFERALKTELTATA